MALPLIAIAGVSTVTSTLALAGPGVPTTPQGIFDDMRTSFRRDKAKGVHARYEFELSEPQGGTWWIVVNDGKYEMGKGALKNPDVTFLCTGTDWVRISNGDISGMRAYFTGRLHVHGNTGLARKLDEIFP